MIRITHIPTNIIIQCQRDRSQHRNKVTAMKMLRVGMNNQKRENEATEGNSEKQIMV